jgi:histone arginine demethylase JMJD6
MEDFVVPRYFAADLLQTAPHGSLLREAWPSLFIGPAGSRCSLHVDAYGTDFWMLQLHGRKAWTLFPREAVPCLLPSYAHGHDAIFGEDVLASEDSDAAGGGKATTSVAQRRASISGEDRGSSAATPLSAWRCMKRWSCVLEPGDIIYVPAGCPHAVSNLTATAAISSNFVSEAHAQLAIDELRIAGLRAPAAAALAEHLDKRRRAASTGGQVGMAGPEAREQRGEETMGGATCEAEQNVKKEGGNDEGENNAPWCVFKRRS